MKLKSLMMGAAFAATMAAAPAMAATEYLVNGGFETGDFTGWTQSGNLGFTSVTSGGYGPQAGNYYVYEGPVGSLGYLSQTFSDTAGQTLVITGWVYGRGDLASEVLFDFNGTTLVDLNPVPSQGWTQYSFTVTATGSDTFTVGFYNNPSFDGLDSFSVVAAPEASTWAMMGLGFAGLAFAGYRGRRTATAVA